MNAHFTKLLDALTHPGLPCPCHLLPSPAADPNAPLLFWGSPHPALPVLLAYVLVIALAPISLGTQAALTILLIFLAWRWSADEPAVYVADDQVVRDEWSVLD
jgi:hypothetical protein